MKKLIIPIIALLAFIVTSCSNNKKKENNDAQTEQEKLELNYTHLSTIYQEQCNIVTDMMEYKNYVTPEALTWLIEARSRLATAEPTAQTLNIETFSKWQKTHEDFNKYFKMYFDNALYNIIESTPGTLQKNDIYVNGNIRKLEQRFNELSKDAKVYENEIANILQSKKTQVGNNEPAS